MKKTSQVLADRAVLLQLKEVERRFAAKGPKPQMQSLIEIVAMLAVHPSDIGVHPSKSIKVARN